jgi:hypothetical protein
MGELKNERQARDLWVSRSHLWAMAAGTLVLAFTAFVLGILVGRKTAPEAGEAELSPDNGSLVEVLARVAAIRRKYGGVEDLHYPDALKGELPPLPPVNPDNSASAPVVLDPGAVVPVGDRPPEEPFTLRIEGYFDDKAEAEKERDALRSRGFDGSPEKRAWILETRSSVAPYSRFQLFIGGFADQGEANAALAEYASAFDSAHKNVVAVANPSPRKAPSAPSAKDTDSPEVPTDAGDQ